MNGNDPSPGQPEEDPFFGLAGGSWYLPSALGNAGGVVQASCSSCGVNLPPPPSDWFASSCCGCGSECVPGRKPCYPCVADTTLGRFLCGVYECICCPDPCYEPRWLPVADTAFFQDAVRPVTQMRVGYDLGIGLPVPDRAEFFWAREMTNPNQLEPQGPSARHGVGRGPPGVASKTGYEDLEVYTEAAAGPVGTFTVIPYRHLDPKTAVNSLNNPLPPESGFADMTVGVKTVLLDCELLQIASQFKTFIPVGSTTKGLGTGHVSLEPSLLFGVRVAEDTAIQAQVAYWIPIGGDPLYEGNVYHGHISLNQVLWRILPDVPVVGTVELNQWTVFQGSYTEPNFLVNGAPVAVSASTTMFSAGPGIRLFVCDKVDFGFGSAFALTGTHWAKQLFVTQFRWRF